MTFKELKEKAEELNTLILKNPKNSKIDGLKSELNKYSSLFLVSERTFQEAIVNQYKQFGKVAKFTVETTPASGYHETNKYVTKNYIVSIYDEKDRSSARPEKRYTWLSRTISKDNLSSAKFDLTFDLFLSPIKTSLFDQTPGMREVYWDMVKGNCREKFKQQAQTYIDPKTGKSKHQKFDAKDTDLDILQQSTGSKTNTSSNRTIG